MSAELKVILSLVDDFTRRATGIESSMGRMGSKIDGTIGMIKKLGAAFGAVVAADKIKQMVDASIEYGSSINDMANKLSMSTDSFQKWDFIAKQSGTSAEAMGVALKNLSKQLYDASQGSKPAGDLFSMFGTAIKDSTGAIRNTDEVMQELMMKLTDIQNPTERAALAQKLFGKNYQSVLEIVNQGKPEIQKLIDQTKEYGMILSEQAIAKLDAAGDSMEKFGLVTKNLGAELTSAFVPTLIAVTEAATKMVQAFSGDEIMVGTGSTAKMLKNTMKEIAEIKHKMAIDATFEGGERLKFLEMEKAFLDNQIKKIKALPATSKEVSSAINAANDRQFAVYNPVVEKTKEKGAGKDKGKSIAERVQETTDDWIAAMLDATNKRVKFEDDQNAKDFKIGQDKFKADQDAMAEDIRIRMGIAEEGAAKQTEIDKKLAADKLRNDQLMIAYAINYAGQFAQTLDMVAQAAGLHGKQMQAIKLSEVWINSGAASMGSWASAMELPYPANLIAGGVGQALIVAQAAAQSALIAKQSFARGGNAQPGMALVGEEGPELVRFKQAGRVYNASQTRSMMNDGAGASQVHVHLTSHAGVTETIVTELRSGSGRRLERAIRDLVR